MKKIILTFTASLVITSTAMAVDFSAPFRAYIEGQEMRRQNERQEQYDSLEQERLLEEIEYKRELRKKLEFENRELQKQKEIERQKEEHRLRAFENFKVNVRPKVVAVHPDFDIIMKQANYWQWAEKQRPALKFAAMDSGDPDDIIWAISEYKDWFSKRTGIQGPIIFQTTPEDLPAEVLEKMRKVEDEFKNKDSQP